MQTFTVGVEFIETKCGPEPHVCRRTWQGNAESEQDAMKRCCEWYGFDEDGIEVTDIRVIDPAPPKEE